MLSHPIRLLSLALIALTAVQSKSAETLRWKFQPGEKITYEITQSMESKADAGTAGRFEVTIAQTSEITWQVDEITAEGNAKIRQRFDRIQFNVTTQDKESSTYDSASSDPPMGMAARFAPLFTAMIDTEFGLELTPRGKIVKVQVPPEFYESMKRVSSTALDELATEESVKQMLSALTIEFPEKPLDVNAEWDSSIDSEVPFLGKLTVDTSYQYVGSKEVDGRPLVAIKPTIEMKPASQTDAQAKTTFGDQSTTGEIYFDAEAGRLHSGQVEQNSKMKMILRDQQVDGTLKQISSLKLKPSK